MFEIRLLGPVEVVTNGEAVAIARTLEAALLARLALNPGQRVSSDRLIDDLWGVDLPSDPRASLNGLAYRLRRTLRERAGIVVRCQPDGYLLEAAPEVVDVSRFERLIEQARGDIIPTVGEKAEVLREALFLWRGQPLTGLERLPFVVPLQTRLNAARLTALAARIEADLSAGLHGRLVEELEGLVAEFPHNERFWYQLMIAYYRSASPADALKCSGRLRAILKEDLGSDPGPEVVALEYSILIHDPSIQWQSTGAGPSSTTVDSQGQRTLLVIEQDDGLLLDELPTFRRINDALRSALPGDRILVRPGVYSESLLLEIPIEIRGDGPLDEIVLQSEGDDTILIETHRAHISNLTIRQLGTEGACAVRIERGKAELQQCHVQSKGAVGISVSGSASPTIRQCHLDRSGIALDISDGATGIFEDNDITRNREHGVVISRGADPTLSGNRINRNKGYGIMVVADGLGLLKNNDMWQNGWSAVGILWGANPTVQGNRLIGNRHYGVWITTGALGKVTQNDISGNEWGGIGQNGGNPTVVGNRIVMNRRYGVWVDSGRGTFIDNNIVDNEIGAWNITEEVQRSLRIEDNIE